MSFVWWSLVTTPKGETNFVLRWVLISLLIFNIFCSIVLTYIIRLDFLSLQQKIFDTNKKIAVRWLLSFSDFHWKLEDMNNQMKTIQLILLKLFLCFFFIKYFTCLILTNLYWNINKQKINKLYIFICFS